MEHPAEAIHQHRIHDGRRVLLPADGDHDVRACLQLTLDFTEDAVREVAKIAAQVNESVENIGARRLQTVMERLLEELSFTAEDRQGETVTIDAAYVRGKLADLASDADLSKYIL